jgi:hypothetical protein
MFGSAALIFDICGRAAKSPAIFSAGSLAQQVHVARLDVHEVRPVGQDADDLGRVGEGAQGFVEVLLGGVAQADVHLSGAHRALLRLRHLVVVPQEAGLHARRPVSLGAFPRRFAVLAALAAGLKHAAKWRELGWREESLRQIHAGKASSLIPRQGLLELAFLADGIDDLGLAGPDHHRGSRQKQC